MSISVSGRHYGVISSMKTTMFVEESTVRNYDNYKSGLTSQSHSKPCSKFDQMTTQINSVDSDG